MKGIFVLFLSSIIVIGCSTHDGDIEMVREARCEGKQWVLINKSSTKRIQFTVEKDSHDINIGLSTKIYTLNPGERKELECGEQALLHTYKIVGEVNI